MIQRNGHEIFYGITLDHERQLVSLNPKLTVGKQQKPFHVQRRVGLPVRREVV